MDGRFERKSFAEINLDDPFFDSLKQDYGGDSPQSFIPWFNRKADEGKKALVFEDANGIGAFINLKAGEDEEIPLDNGTILPRIPRMKISTMKIDDRYRGRRIGEGALGLTLWKWRDSGSNEIYVTVYPKHETLILLLERYGFTLAGKKANGECVYIKDRRHLDFSDPCKAFPFLSGSIQQAGCIPIDMTYHDTMFAASEVANTLQERVDISVANGLKKVYIGSAKRLGFKAGDPVFIYRKYTGNQGKPGHKSCITSYCISTRIEIVKSNGQELIPYDKYRHIIGNKSVFDDMELQTKYNTLPNLTLIELLYYGFFGAGNNVNWFWLNDNGCWPGYPISATYTREQFDKIMRRGNVDVENVIIN